MPLKKLSITMFFLIKFLNAQCLQNHYKGGEQALIFDLSNKIEIPKCCYDSNSISHLYEAIVVISNLGKIDSIIIGNRCLNNYDTIVNNAIKSTKDRWIKSRKNLRLYLRIWFINDLKDSFILLHKYISPLPLNSSQNLTVLPDIYISLENQKK